MNLIDAYLSEVGRHLPQKNRADIEAEIRSALQDLLEERARQRGKPADDEETVLEVLKEYGDPEKVAASYQPERYIIGPRLYPAYVKVLQIVLPIVGILSLLGLGFSLAQAESADLLETVVQAIAGFFSAMISALGSITLIFALLERFVPDLKTKEARWDPRSLRKVSPPDHIKPVELILEILFSGLAIVIFNFFPQLVNIGYYSDGSWWVGFISTQTGQAWETTLLSEAFFRYLPALNIVWGLTIVLDVILFQRGRWEVWSRWALVGIKALMIGIAAIMLAGPSLIGVTAQSLLEAGFPAPEAADILVTMMNQGVRVALVLTILFDGLDLVKALIRLFGQGKPVVLQNT